MKCPFCGNQEDRVIDSRSSREGNAIRRRRECLACGKRFTSYERVEEVAPPVMVVKKDGRREPFDMDKLRTGLRIACRKRPVQTDRIDSIAEGIEKKIVASGAKEIESTWIGEEVMSSLKDVDEVAYVRFASVYRQFGDIQHFIDEVRTFFSDRQDK